MSAMVYPNWQTTVVFAPDGPQPQTLVENTQVKVVIVGLEAGQKLPPHPQTLAIYHFLQGTGWMIVDDERHPVSAGTIIITPNGAKRGIEAETRLAFLATRMSKAE